MENQIDVRMHSVLAAKRQPVTSRGAAMARDAWSDDDDVPDDWEDEDFVEPPAAGPVGPARAGSTEHSVSRPCKIRHAAAVMDQKARKKRFFFFFESRSPYPDPFSRHISPVL